VDVFNVVYGEIKLKAKISKRIVSQDWIVLEHSSLELWELLDQ
jgi:hypothetical protein